MGAVTLDDGSGVGSDRSVPRRQDDDSLPRLRDERHEDVERGEVGREIAVGVGDEAAALAENRVAAEEDVDAVALEDEGG